MDNLSYEDAWEIAFAMGLSEIEGANNAEVGTIRDIFSIKSDSERIASKLVECLEDQDWRWIHYNGPLLSNSDRREMARQWVFRIEKLTHALYRRNQILSIVDLRPYWMLRAEASSQCAEFDRTIRHYSDPFWQEHLPPCSRPICNCTVHSLSMKQAEYTSCSKEKSDPVPSSPESVRAGLYFLSLVVPPLVVHGLAGPRHLVINLVLCLMGWFPGVAHAAYLVRRFGGNEGS